MAGVLYSVDIARKVVVEEETIVVVRTFVLSCRILGMARAIGMTNGIREIILEMRLKGMVDGGMTK